MLVEPQGERHEAPFKTFIFGQRARQRTPFRIVVTHTNTHTHLRPWLAILWDGKREMVVVTDIHRVSPKKKRALPSADIYTVTTGGRLVDIALPLLVDTTVLN